MSYRRFGDDLKNIKLSIKQEFVQLTLGTLFTAAGAFLILTTRTSPSWITTTGKVIGSSNTSGKARSPVIQYQVDDQSYTVTTNNRSSEYPDVGGSLQVAYNPSNPNQSKIIEPLQLEFFFWGLFLLGISALLPSAIRLIYSARSEIRYSQPNS